MNIGTGRSLWHSEDNDRSIAFPLMGKVRMVIPCEPWKLSISLAGIELSKNWVRATLDRKAFEKHFSFEDLDHVFRLDDKFGIQIEPEKDFLPTPTLRGALSSRDVFSGGIQLQFNFTNSNGDLEELLQELSQFSPHQN